MFVVHLVSSGGSIDYSISSRSVVLMTVSKLFDKSYALILVMN